MKVRQEKEKEESSLKQEYLTDLAVADSEAEETKGGPKINLEVDTFSWGVVNPGRLG